MNEQQQDEIFKEKLQQLHVPFDAQAWAQMDAMLNKKQKKRGFILWWICAGSALLFMSSIALYFYSNSENKIYNTNTTITTENTENTIKTNNSKTFQKPATNNTTIQHVNSSNNTSNNYSTTEVVPNNKNDILPLSKTKNDNGSNNNGNNIAYTKNNNPPKATANNIVTTNKKIKRSNKTKNINKVNNTALAPNNNTNYNEALISFLIAGIDNIIFEPEAMALIDIKKTEEKKETIKAPIKKKVHYAFGVSGIVAATTVGQQANKANNFFRKPYYAVGFYHEVVFGTRVAITNGIQYGKNYFEITKPINNVFETQPEKYSCNISMLNIPVGIKVNVVAKEKFNWYLHTGINNHIKLKENFEFLVYPPTDTTQTNPISDPVPTNVSVQTNLSGGNAQYESLNADFSSGFGVNSASTKTTADFSINNAKRYYVSAYIASGVEYILKSRWHFFIEPTFQISINAIGIQQKRTHHLGVGSGIRVQF